MHVPRPRASASESTTSALTEQEAFDLKCIRFRNVELARIGCGDPECALDTCAVARHARLIVRALDALETLDPASPSGRTSGPVPKSP